uniref:Uncharacterized protein n=1 Tax=Avena sativa TaxID=4498 RepID=A0ACD5ZWZ7_AVESA
MEGVIGHVTRPYGFWSYGRNSKGDNSSKQRSKKESGKTCGETQRADDARVERQITSEIHMHQRDTSKVPISETVGGKRSLSHGSESSRARKDAKIINAKVEMTQLKNSKTPRRKMSPIVSRSPIMNMIARNKAQSHAGTSKSPKLHARSPNLHPRSPNQAGTSRSPNLHDLSPTLAHGTPTTSDELPPTATNGSKRKPRKLTSIVWNDAEPIYIDGLLTQGRCKYCNTVFPASKVSGSSQLARHLKVCEVKCSMDGVVQQIRTSDEIDPDWKFDQQAARFELVKLIVLHGLPFSFVEYAGFRKFCASLNPWFKSVNRVTVQNDCMDAYYSYRSIYQNFFMNCNHRVSLTGDMWTSNQKLGYLCITCHWIDMIGTLRRIFSFTMDNAEVNTKMISHLRKNLVDRGLIHHEGKLLHNMCACHVLNLIVQDGLKVKEMNSIMDNTRESVKYIRSSQGRKEQFAKMVTQAGITCKHQPTPDVSSRWNSTFLMLESVLPFRKVFETLQQQEPNYTFCPSTEEWKMVKDICQLLKVFCQATNVISGSNYPTSNRYFFEIWGVKLILDEQAKSNNPVIRIMVNEMKNKFHKYFMESYLTNCIPFDILKWWDVNSARYPTLGRIARDVLAVPASPVASESAFSTCGRVITDHRSSLAPKTVEALMCFGDWIRPSGSSEASTLQGVP